MRLCVASMESQMPKDKFGPIELHMKPSSIMTSWYSSDSAEPESVQIQSNRNADVSNT